MQLDPVRPKRRQGLRRSKHVVPGLPRQPVDQMYADPDAPFLQRIIALTERRKAMPPVNPHRCCIVHRLKTQLHRKVSLCLKC